MVAHKPNVVPFMSWPDEGLKTKMRHYRDNVVMVNSNCVYPFKGPPAAEIVRDHDGNQIRSEQKNEKLAMEMIRRYTAKKGIVVDLFMGTFTTARACMLMQGFEFNCWGWEIDPDCYDAGYASLCNLWATQRKKPIVGPTVRGGGQKDNASDLTQEERIVCA